MGGETPPPKKFYKTTKTLIFSTPYLNIANSIYPTTSSISGSCFPKYDKNWQWYIIVWWNKYKIALFPKFNPHVLFLWWHHIYYICVLYYNNTCKSVYLCQVGSYSIIVLLQAGIGSLIHNNCSHIRLPNTKKCVFFSVLFASPEK